VTRPKFRRNESTGTIGGPVVIPGLYDGRNKTFFFATVGYTRFLSGYANRSTVYTGIPTGLGDVRTRDTMAVVANRYIAEGVQDDPTLPQNILTRIRTFPADQVSFLERKFFTNTTPGQVAFRSMTPSDIHPVAINILNKKRNGSFYCPASGRATPSCRAEDSSAASRSWSTRSPPSLNPCRASPRWSTTSACRIACASPM